MKPIKSTRLREEIDFIQESFLKTRGHQGNDSWATAMSDTQFSIARKTRTLCPVHITPLWTESHKQDSRYHTHHFVHSNE